MHNNIMHHVFPGMLVIIAFLLPGIIPSVAENNKPEFTAWANVASSCPVDETSQQKYDSHVHVLQFMGNETGSIFSRCSIALQEIVAPSLSLVLDVTYKDADGPGSTYQVRALLRRVRRTDGANFLVTEFDSNNFPASSETQTNHVKIDHNFDFDENDYYVEFRLTRNSLADNTIAGVVRLRGIILVD